MFTDHSRDFYIIDLALFGKRNGRLQIGRLDSETQDLLLESETLGWLLSIFESEGLGKGNLRDL